jgi:hypothetical protein
MTKTYRQVPAWELAAELNKAFASAEPHTICKAIGQIAQEFQRRRNLENNRAAAH